MAMTFFLASGCWGGQHFNPRAQVDIHATTEVQAKILQATVEFGERNGFKVDAGADLPRDGRLVAQVLLTRPDGVLVTTSNFMHEDILQTFFVAEKDGADWRTVKEKWLAEMRSVVGDRGSIVDVILEEMPKSE
jgi:hypothetical protein